MCPRTVILIFLLSSVVVLNSAGAKLIQESIFDIGLVLHYHFRSGEDVNAVPENLIASPLGLSLGLGLVELGASRSIKQLIVDDLFHWKDGEVELHRRLTAIQEVLKSSYQHKPKEEMKMKIQSNYTEPLQRKDKVTDLEDVEVNIQCAIFHREGLNLSNVFKLVKENGYDSQFVVLNQSLTTPQRQAIINEWAQNATKNLIREFPAPEKFDLLMANTVYFEGDWVEPFANEYTRKGVFKSKPNAIHSNVTFMLGQLEDVPYYEDGNYQMIRMAYKTRSNDSQNIGMFVVLPREERSLGQVIDELSFDSFRDVIKNKMRLHTVNVKLPKVKLNQRIPVKEVIERIQDLKKLRWTRAATTMNSTKPHEEINLNATAASSESDFMLSDFIQDVVLEVNEKGTRAAAVTGGYINYDSFKKNFRCDRPYLMLIYDNQHDVVLFWATIYRPRVD